VTVDVDGWHVKVAVHMSVWSDTMEALIRFGVV
jgi:hypothetical protein